MDEIGMFGLERALAACLICARSMASRDAKTARVLRPVIALLESAHAELTNPDAPRATA